MVRFFSTGGGPLWLIPDHEKTHPEKLSFNTRELVAGSVCLFLGMFTLIISFLSLVFAQLAKIGHVFVFLISK